MKKTALLAFLFVLPVTAHAEIFKCVENDHTTFQDFPCVNGNSETVDTNNLTIIAPPKGTAHPQPSRSVTTPPRPRLYLPYLNRHQTDIKPT